MSSVLLDVEFMMPQLVSESGPPLQPPALIRSCHIIDDQMFPGPTSVR